MTPAQYLRMGSILGYSAREAMFMPPGLLFDLWELYLQSQRSEGE